MATLKHSENYRRSAPAEVRQRGLLGYIFDFKNRLQAKISQTFITDNLKEEKYLKK